MLILDVKDEKKRLQNHLTKGREKKKSHAFVRGNTLKRATIRKKPRWSLNSL